MIQSNNYILRDILHTAKSGGLDEIRKICKKYMARYKNDMVLLDLCSFVLEDLGETREEGFAKKKEQRLE